MKYLDVIAENADFEDFRVTCEHAKSVSLLASVDGLLQWDEQTMLPAAAGDFRADQAAALAALISRSSSPTYMQKDGSQEICFEA